MLTQQSASWSPRAWIRIVCGGEAVNSKSNHSQRFRCLPRDLQRAILDLPEPLQHAVHYAVAHCQPQYAPRPYADDWREELYHEAVVAAWEAYQTHDPKRGASLYGWGVRVIGQRLQVFCDSVWGAAKRECEYPCDEETGEPMEFPDPNAFEAVEGRILVCAVQQALQNFAPQDAQVGAWYLLEGLNEQAIAARLGVSQPAVSKRLKRILAQLRRELGVENAERSP